MKNGSSGAHIYNNILMGGSRGGFEYHANCLDGIRIDYNIYFRSNSGLVVTEEDVREFTLTKWRQGKYDLHSLVDISGDTFKNPAGTDFHLKNSAAAVDMGVDRGLGFDFEGDVRPQGASPDVGADEIRE